MEEMNPNTHTQPDCSNPCHSHPLPASDPSVLQTSGSHSPQYDPTDIISGGDAAADPSNHCASSPLDPLHPLEQMEEQEEQSDPNPNSPSIFTLEDHAVSNMKTKMEQGRLGHVLKKIPTPVVLVVLLLAFLAFGISLWRYGKQVLLVHISLGMIVGIGCFVFVCIGFLLWKHKDRIRHLIHAKSFLENQFYRYRHDIVYKIRITLFCSLVGNVLFVLMKTTSGLLYHSVWFLTLAVYYFLLAILRLILLMYLQKPEQEDSELLEWKRYRWVGAVLLMMNHVLTGMTGYMVANQNAFVYPGLLLYGMAIYTVYTLGSAIFALFRFRKYGAPVLSAAKIVSLTSALVSLLALESASITAFGGIFRKDHVAFTAGSGAIVCYLVLMMSLYMLVHSTKKIQKLKYKRSFDNTEAA